MDSVFGPRSENSLMNSRGCGNLRPKDYQFHIQRCPENLFFQCISISCYVFEHNHAQEGREREGRREADVCSEKRSSGRAFRPFTVVFHEEKYSLSHLLTYLLWCSYTISVYYTAKTAPIFTDILLRGRYYEFLETTVSPSHDSLIREDKENLLPAIYSIPPQHFLLPADPGLLLLLPRPQCLAG